MIDSPRCCQAHSRRCGQLPGSGAELGVSNALVTSSVAAILFLLTVAAVAKYGDRIRVHGWTPARAGGETIVARVDPEGPAHGILQPGDVVTAWNGDRRAGRVGIIYFRRTLPRDPEVHYDLTIRRAGVERTVALTAPARPNSGSRRNRTRARISGGCMRWRGRLPSPARICVWWSIAI